MSLLPQLNGSYEPSPSMWEDLTSEIDRIITMINSNADLTPEDVKHVRSLAKQVRDYGVKYRKEITVQATAYKQLLDKKLSELGYSTIEDYIHKKQQEQKAEQNQRLNAKISHFNSIVQEELNNTTYVKNSNIANFVPNAFLSRFPKINSSAKKNEIDDWSPIKSIIHISLVTVDKCLKENPIMMQLPASSNSLRSMTNYLETGSQESITEIKNTLMLDKDLIQRLTIKQRVKTSKSTVNEIQSVLKSDIDDNTKLQRISLLLEIYKQY